MRRLSPIICCGWRTQFRSIYFKRAHIGVSNTYRDITRLSDKEDEKISNGQMVRALAGYVWPREKPQIRRRVLMSLSVLFASKAATVTTPLVFGKVVDLYSTVNSAADAGIMLIALYAIMRTSAALFNEGRNALFAKVSHDSTRSLARNVFLHLHRLDLSFHLSKPTGGLAKVVDRGTRSINFVLSALVFNIVPTAFELAIVTSLLYYKFGWEYSAICLTFTSVYAIFSILVTQWRTKYRVAMNAADNEAGRVSVDSFVNYETVKYFNNEEREAKRYDRFLALYEEASLKTTKSLAWLNSGQNAIVNCALFATMAYASTQILATGNGGLSVGDLVAINGLIFQLSLPLNFLGSVYRETRQALLDMRLMFELLQQTPKIIDKADAKVLDAKLAAKIDFCDVKFAYGDLRVLNGLTMTIESGRRYAIVGGSGSGKSTLVRLLYRFYDVDGGGVSINNIDIRDMTLDSLRRSICVVPQDTPLFNETIRYNISYGAPDEVSDEDVLRVSKMCELHESVARMPLGYKTMVGERGLKLSGGEKQRIAIARALLKNSSIIIYDEATSSLDSITEKSIMQALKRAIEGKTVIMIAHRLSTIVDADQILVLENGRVSAQGTHSELLKSSEMYAELWAKQNEEAIRAARQEVADAVERDAPFLIRKSCCNCSMTSCSPGCACIECK